VQKRGKVTLVERRGWLTQYEEGVSIDRIAKKSGRTQRTVTEQLKQARSDLQHDQVQLDLIQKGYRDHYRDLLHIAERLAESADSPHRGVVLSIENPDDPRERLLYQALRSHTPGSSIWTAVKRWEEDTTGIAEEIDRLEAQATKLVSKDTADFPEISIEGFAGSLRDAVSMAAQGLDPEATEYWPDRSGGSTQLRFGSYILSASAPDVDRMAEIEKMHRSFLKTLLAPESANRLRSLWRSWAEAKGMIREEVAILKLRKVLPGRCDLCPAGDTSARRPSQRRRNE
jgi:hypothetical protein